MKEIAELIKAIADLLWPILGFTVLIIFRTQFAEIISRIKKGKLLGQEFELSEDLKNLQKAAIEASEEVASIPTFIFESTKNDEDTKSNGIKDEHIKTILYEASRSPKLALISLGSEIEKEAKQTFASLRKLKVRSHVSLIQAVNELKHYYGLPEHVENSLRQFWSTRNKIIHGGLTEDGNILSAIDSGVTILKALQSLPRETNWVQHADVTIYSDSDCKHKMSGVKGIVLTIESPIRKRVPYRILPSTKTHFKRGMKVSWEWNFDNVWDSAWYKDPETSEIKQAWNSSIEFIGRNINDI